MAGAAGGGSSPGKITAVDAKGKATKITIHHNTVAKAYSA
jgi:Cu/Ag efflux protein CusF